MATDVKIILSAEDRTRATIEGMIGRLTDMNSAASLVRGGLAQLAAGLSIGAMVSFAKATIDGIDALNDLKDATGSSIENISALEDVAKRTGTSFDTVGSALIKFNKLLNDAKPGSDAEAALKALNLNINELKTLDPAEAMRQTAVALAGFADDGNKGRLMLELFGKSTRDVSVFLADLAEKQKLVGTVTTEAALEAEKFNKEIFNLKKNTEDGARALATDLVIGINAAAKALRESGLAAGLKTLFTGTEQFKSDKALVEASETHQMLESRVRLAVASGAKEGDRGLSILQNQLATAKAQMEIMISQRNAPANQPPVEPPKPSIGTVVGTGGKSGKGSPGPAIANSFDSLNASLDKYLALNQAAEAQEQDLSATERLRISTLAELDAKRLSGNLTLQQAVDLEEKLSRVVSAGLAAEAIDKARKTAAAQYKSSEAAAAAYNKTLADGALAAERAVSAAEDELAAIGLLKSGVQALTLAKLQGQLAAGNLTAEETAALNLRIDAQQKLIAVQRNIEQTAAASQSAQQRQAARAAEADGVQQFIADQEAAALASARSAEASATAAQAEFDAFGKTKTQLAELTLARLQDSQVNLTAGTVAYDAVQRQIDAQQKLIGLLQKGELRDAATDAADKAAKAWRQTADSINASLTDALLRGFESGKDFGQNFADTLENMLKTAILRPLLAKVLDPISLAVSSGITGLLGFEGGGYTGAGLRTGGLDGKGGFMAMLHPQETVIDHTQGGGSSPQPSVTVVQNFTVGDVASVSLVRQAVANSERRIASSIGRSMSYGGAIG